MNLIIDVGNTRIKAAVFENDSLVALFVFEEKDLVLNVEKIVSTYSILRGIISSVTTASNSSVKKIKELLPFMELNAATKVPFNNLYKTPKTLGVDRIALVARAVEKYPNKNVLIIDAGTCITYDFVTSNKEYLGGAISLGIKMRYTALHEHTAKLPLLETYLIDNFIGNSTESSIHSGVIYGVLNEIKGVIRQYQRKNKDLTVVLTGGDTNFLAKQLKSSIFANPNFVLEGLNTILTYNKEEC
ncbi:MAG: type III pantothenate kinase [Polaribacter sp.]|nr:type III pantothenate kinase [Polaribacter sp.]